MLFKTRSNYFALLCLMGTIWASIATSSANGTFYGNYKIKSDCVTPTFSQVVEISSSTNFDATVLGFPEVTLNLKSPNSGYLNGKYRSCEETIESEDSIDDAFLYSCSDDGQFVCNVYFESL